MNTVRMSLGLLLFRYGDFAQLASSSRRWFGDANARHDGFAANILFGVGFGHVALLMEDQPAELAQLHARYVGGGGDYEWLHEREAEHRRSFMMKR